MARILLSAPNDLPWSIGQYLIRGLKAMGLDAAIFDYRSAGDVEGELFALVESFRPDVHLLYKGELLNAEMIERLKGLGVYTILWHDDVDEQMPEWLVTLVRAHDAFFTPARGMVARFQEMGFEKVAWLSGGFDPDAHAFSTITDEERRRFSSDVVFVGRIMNHVLYAGRYKMIQRVIREGIDIKWWGYRIPRKLRTIPYCLSRVARAWGGQVAYNESYAKIVACTKIALGWDIYPQVDGAVCNRAYVTCGCGGFYLTRYVEGIEGLFELDKEIVVFRTIDEMVDKTRYYLAHDDERRRIAQAGRARVLENYTYVKRFQEMFDTLRAWGGPDVR